LLGTLYTITPRNSNQQVYADEFQYLQTIVKINVLDYCADENIWTQVGGINMKLVKVE
jgi:hypothetical protein